MKEPRPYIEHILQECNFLIEQSREITFEDFIKDPVLIRAFERSLEIIGEAVKNLPTSFKEKYKEIPWKQIAGMRDKLVHEYFGVDYKLLWETVRVYVPELKRQIEEIMKKRVGKHPIPYRHPTNFLENFK